MTICDIRAVMPNAAAHRVALNIAGRGRVLSWNILIVGLVCGNSM